MGDDDVRRSRLDSGLGVVTERLPALRSVSIGCWVGTGARDEPDALAGASHFLEHLLFKGTDRWSAAQIAEAIESVGGDMNAFTAPELTAFHVRVPDDCLDLAVEILSDIVWSPAFREPDLESERQVLLEEIRMHEDTPDDVVHSLFAAALFPGHPIGRAVIGTEATVSAMECRTIADFHTVHYHPTNIVVAAAGNLDHDRVRDRLEAALGRFGGCRPPRLTHPGDPPARRLAVVPRHTEQVHLVLGTRSLSRRDPDRFALMVLNQALGGGMSSRLFREVREERGLAYAVYSYGGAFEETGLLAIYAGTAPDRADELLDVLEAQLDRVVADGGVGERELAAAKGHLKGSVALSLESSSSRMHRLGRSELTLGAVPSLDELVARVDAVSAEDVARVVERVLARCDRTLAVVGPVDEARLVDRVGAVTT